MMKEKAPEKVQYFESLSNPIRYVPTAMFFTKGKGIHKDSALQALNSALRDAKISDLNLVSVSSIKSPRCKIISIQEGRNYLLPEQVTFAVMARASTNEPNRLIAASIGLANPADESQHGYLSEHHCTGTTAQKAGDYAEDMAMEMLATILDLPNDSSLTWDEREEQWRLSGKIYRTQNFTQSAEGHKDGLWTTVLSAPVMVLP